MSELKVVIIAHESEDRTVLQMLVDNTSVARTAWTLATPPVSVTDPLLRRLQDQKPDVILVDIAPNATAANLRAIELLHAEAPSVAIFALGEMTQPQIIVNAMRAGAREYIERPPSTTHLLEAFVRLTSAQRKAQKSKQRGTIITVLNAKGGCGATMVAVNTALALQSSHGHVALVDLAQLGHTALHLNLKPTFTITDVLRNLHRLDGALLEGYMLRHENGLQLLAGATDPVSVDSTTADFAKLFDLLVNQYSYVIVDASSRLDPITRIACDVSEQVLLIAHADVPSLWSAARVQQFIVENGNRDRVRLVLNRYRKIAGFSDSDVEKATGAKVFWKLPNHYPTVATSIDRGIPVTQTNHSEMARSFIGLASSMTANDASEKRRSWSIFKTA